MASPYILEQRILAPRLQLPITEDEFLELGHARKVLSEALAFEQGYELLLGNFMSMEMAFSEIGLRATLEPRFDYEDAAHLLRQANRHVVNVLTALRSYADQVPQLFKCLKLSPSFKDASKAALNAMYGRSSAYRFLYELRNHVQHKAEAVHAADGGAGDTDDPNGWVEAVRLHADKKTLLADGFKTRVLDEQPEKIDVRQQVRFGMQDIGEVHLLLRALVSEQIAQGRKSIESAIARYAAAGASSTLGLCARRIGDPAADVPVFLNWDDTRVALVSKNGRPPRLWPRRSHRHPSAEEVRSLREAVGNTPKEAAGVVGVTEERWRHFEASLPMPPAMFQFYQLQVEHHPTHTAEQRSSPIMPAPGTRTATDQQV